MQKIESVKDAIEKAILKSRKLKESILLANWQEIVGEVHKKSKPLYIKEKTLNVVVESSVYLQHMYMHKNNYIKKSNLILKGEYIEDVKLRVGKIEKEEITTENVAKENKEVSITENEMKKIEASLIEIKDNEIKDKLLKLKIEALKRQKSLTKTGYKTCISCGTLFKETKDNLCHLCKIEGISSREERVIENLKKNPYLTLKNLQDLKIYLDKETFEEYKKRRLDSIYRLVIVFIKNKDKEKAKEYLKEYLKVEINERDEEILEEKSEKLTRLISEKFKGYDDVHISRRK